MWFLGFFWMLVTRFFVLLPVKQHGRKRNKYPWQINKEMEPSSTELNLTNLHNKAINNVFIVELLMDQSWKVVQKKEYLFYCPVFIFSSLYGCYGSLRPWPCIFI